MKQKMSQSIAKIMNTNMNAYQTHIYFNMYLVKSIFFRSGIISLNEKQLRILEKMYKVPILKKLGLGKTFPRYLLYTVKSALSLGLIWPKTVLAMTML